MALALPPKFLRELENAARKPFALLSISSTGQSSEMTSEVNWHGSTTLTNVDHDPTPPATGDVILDPHAADTTDGDKYFSIVDSDDQGGLQVPVDGIFWDKVDDDPHDSDTTSIAVAGAGDYIDLLSSGANILTTIPDNATVHSVSLLSVVKWVTFASTFKHRLTVDGSTYVGAQKSPTNSFTQITTEWTNNPDTAAAWARSELLDIQQMGYIQDGGGGSVNTTQLYLIVKYKDFEATGQIVTSNMDLGSSADTANSGTVSIDDIVPSGSGLAYTAEGSTSGAWGGEEVALGAVEDGSSVAGYRYYRVTANFTSDGSVTPVLKSIKIEIPDNVYLYSSLSDYTLNAYPFLKSIPGRNIKLNMKDMITEGSSLTVTLVRNDIVDTMVRSDNFRGLNTTIKIGMFTDDVTVNDLILYYSGTISDYAVTETELNITLKDLTKDLSGKYQVQSAGTSRGTVSIDGVHMAVVIETIMDAVGVASRYIDRGSLNTVEANIGDGTPAASSWVVKRTGNMIIAEPTAAKTLISELLILMGVYMVVQESGKAVFIEYDSSTTAEETWGKNELLAGFTYKPNLESIRNLIALYYDWDGTGESEADFASIYVAADVTSQTAWDLTAQKVIKSKWIAGDSGDGYYGDEMASHIVDREAARLANGLGVLSCRTSLDKAHIQVGDFINIDSSDGIDVLFAADVASEATQKLIVTSKNWDVAGGSINWELTEAR